MKYKHGSPKFYKLIEEEAELHDKKNADYAEAGDVWGNFDRVAHLVDFYNLLNAPISTRVKVAIIYMLKQLDCALNAFGKGKKMKVEGIKERFQDISVYSKIITILSEEKNGK